MIEIKSVNGKVLYVAKDAASVRAAVVEAILSRANLSGANLSGAILSGADLYEADGVEAWRVTPLMVLLDQPGPIRAYKLVKADGTGPYYTSEPYAVGYEYSVADADTTSAACGAGINLATMDWILREWQPGYRILVAEFAAEDIASIPSGTDGKFRVHRCKIVAEKNLADLGLV